MEHTAKQRAAALLLGGFTEEEVIDCIAMEFQVDEFQKEDLPHHVARVNKHIKSLGEVT